MGATFSFGLVQLVAFLALGTLVFLIGTFVHPIAAVVVAVLGTALLLAGMSGARSRFISALYHNVTGDPVEHFHQHLIDELFVQVRNYCLDRTK